MSDPRRQVPRTDVVLADPRLVAARDRLGGSLVKGAVAHAQELARSGGISPSAVADAAVAALPPIAATLRRQQHHLRPPPGHHRPTVTAHDPHQPAALILIDLAHPHTPGHRPSLVDQHPPAGLAESLAG